MYRVSVEMLPGYWDRIDFLMRWSEDFADVGIVLGADLESPDVRLVHHGIALKEWEQRPGQIDIPLIVYERADQANIQLSQTVRALLMHHNVKFWLKRNTFRDFALNNEAHLRGYWHYAQLLKYPSLKVSELPDIKSQLLVSNTAIDPDTYRKVRLLPVVPHSRFDSLVEPENVCSPDERNIDVNFAGQVDYRGLDEVLALHRRAAVLSIINMRQLKTFVGLNGSVRWDIYLDTLKHSKISVSPWGYGEYSYRDYESILCGCVMIKPDTDHVRTFPPDLYQSNKYYIPCRPDFEDLPSIAHKILSDYKPYHSMALRARNDLLLANTRNAVVEYFLDLFDSIRFNEADTSKTRNNRAKDGGAVLSTFLQARDGRTSIIDLRTTVVTPVRCHVNGLDDDPLATWGERPLHLSEDLTENDTHDVRLLSSNVAGGQYDLILGVRPRERQKVCLIVHRNWKDQVRITFDLEALRATVQLTRGDTFEFSSIRCRQLYSDWRMMKAQLRINGDPGDVALCVALVDPGKGLFYTGDGRAGADLGILSLYESGDDAGTAENGKQLAGSK